jgi:hypothetical protein
MSKRPRNEAVQLHADADVDSGVGYDVCCCFELLLYSNKTTLILTLLHLA